MKITIMIILTLVVLIFSKEEKELTFELDEKYKFGLGEEINYRVHFGFVNAATAKMIIYDDLVKINDKTCYKIDVFGRTIGMFDLFLRVRDNWGTYLAKDTTLPMKCYRNIAEGKYRKKEIVYFDQNNNIAQVRVFDNEKEKWKDYMEYPIPSNSQEMVSGYYYLRTLDFKKIKKNEIINVNAFFEDKSYDFKIRFLGRTTLTTKLGTINSLVITPIMPENSLFDGKNAIKVWISDDSNKVPLKIKAKMFVGAVEVDLESYKQGKKQYD